MSDIKSWSTTASQNMDAVPNGFPEEMAPSGVNDAAREVMAAVRRQWNDAEWFNFGSGDKTPSYLFVSSTVIKVVDGAGIIAEYHTGRRVKYAGAATIYGTIQSSVTNAADLDVTVTWDSGNAVNESFTLFLHVLRSDNSGLPQNTPYIVPDGSAASPSIRFASDPDTGLFLKAAGEIGLSVGGVERVSFKDDGTLTGPKLGGWELLRSKTPSNQAEVVFDEGDIGTKYQHYCWAFRGVHPVLLNSSLRLQVSTDGGTVYLNTGYAYNHIRLASDNTGDTYTVIKSNSSGLYLFTSSVDADPKRGVTGFVYMDQVDIANSRPTFRTHIDCEDSVAEFNSIIGGGRSNTFDVVNAVKFFFGPAATNISGGKIDLYGLRNA